MKDKKTGIIGAGPAGAWLAFRLAAAGFKVVLFDHRAPWEKPCGGGMSNVIFEKFKELEPLKEQAFPNHSARIINADGFQFVSPLSRPFLTISRQVLGKFLMEKAIAAGAEFRSVKICGIEKIPRGFRLLDEKGPAEEFDFLAGADGAGSRTRSFFCPRWSRPDYFFAFSFHLPRPVNLPITLKFFKGMTGYAWIFPSRQSTSLGIGSKGMQFSLAQMFSMLETMIEAEPELREIKPRLKQESTRALIPALRFSALRRQRIAGPDWALVGDASGAANSVSGGGIPYAFWSADLLADALVSGRIEQYQSAWWRMCKDNLVGPSIWGPVFYHNATQKVLSRYLRRSASAQKLTVGLLSEEKLGRKGILAGLANMVAGR